MRGTVASELTHQDRFDTFAGTLSDVEVFWPATSRSSARTRRSRAFFELYQNVTPFVAQLQRSLWWVTAGVVVVFALLYLMQFLVVRRAQGILEDQEGRIKAARDTLEIQVAARTDELKRTNSQLEGEISERRQAQSKLNYLAYHDPADRAGQPPLLHRTAGREPARKRPAWRAAGRAVHRS
jgi:FtsZ-binding cell division protein ZapB